MNKKFVFPEIPTGKKWVTDPEGNIYYQVISTRLTGKQWIPYLGEKEHQITDPAKNVLLRHATESPREGVIYKIVVRPGYLFDADDRFTSTFRQYGAARGCQTPHWQVACLTRELFTNKELHEMGLNWIMPMHDPITNSKGEPYMLYTGMIGLSSTDWRSNLFARHDEPFDRFNYACGGFGYLIP